MAKVHLTQKFVDKLTAPDPSGRDQIFWDDELKGFGVRVSGKTATRMFVVQRDLPGGKPRRVNIAPTNTMKLEEAKLSAADVLNDLRRGIDPKRRRVVPTLQSTLNAYLEARPNLAPDSVRMYRQVERWLKEWMLLPLVEITPDMVEARHRTLAATIAKVHGERGYKGHSAANFAMKALRALYSFAEDRHADLPPNPVRRLKRAWYTEPRRVRVVPTEKLAVFYAAVLRLENAIQRDFIVLLIFTGLRCGEAARLKWADIDFAEQIIRIPATSTKAKRKLDLPMSDVVRDMLIARRALGNSGFVFPGRFANTHLADAGISFEKIAETTGIYVSAHDLRRTFASIAGSTEISPYALKAMLNHSVGSDITSGYVILSVPALAAAVQKVADRMKELCGIVDVEGPNVTRLTRK